MKRILISILLVNIVLILLFTNNKINTSAKSNSLGEGYSAILYDNSNGLPTSEANAVAQTSDGFIWIGGYSGLTRYDGNNFERYDSSTGVASVVSLYVDSKDRLWIGTNDSGVALLEGNSFKFFNYGDAQSSLSIRAIIEDNNNNILFATTLGMYYIDKDLKVERINDGLINNEYICDLYMASNNIIYGVTNSGGVFSLKDLKVLKFFKSDNLEMGIFNTIYPDMEHDNYVYIGNQQNDIYYGDFTTELKDSIHYETDTVTNLNTIRKIESNLWVVGDNGIGYFDEENDFNILAKLPMTNSIDRMMVDHEQNIWFTSSRQGVMKIVRNNFIDLSSLANLDPLVVNSTCYDNNLLYIATDTGLHILNNKYEEVYNDLTTLLTNVRIRCVKKDSNNNLWFCTYGAATGLVKYVPQSGLIRCFTDLDGLASSRVRMLTELSDGSLAICTNLGINIMKNDVVTQTLDSSMGLTTVEFLCIEEMSDGNLLLGSDGDGIYKVKGNTLSRIGKKDGLKSEVILRIKKDDKLDLYWIITSNSIAYLKDGIITNLDTFPYPNNFDVYFDNNNHLWILSSGGIYSVEKNSIFEGDLIYTLYDKECGLPAIPTANSYSHITSDGTLYVAASTGVFSVNINTDFGKLGDVIINVPYLIVDDVYTPITNKEITISASSKRISIYAQAFTYSLYNPQVEYYLEGFDTNKVTISKRDLSPVVYTNLHGGTYKFHFNLLNSLTGAVEQELVITINKQKAVTEYTIFYIGLVLIGALIIFGIIFGIFNVRAKKLKEKQKENQRLINEMTTVFAHCIDMKDAYTNGHSSRVALYTVLIAKELGKSNDELEKIYNIALLHDIGKISIPDAILNKPGKLDDDEYAVMKSHSPNGYEVLKDITIAPEIALGAGCHHEKYDGTGYPNHLKGDQIPEVAQMISVADTFDAMYSTRPYRRKLPLEDVVKEITRCSGTQFNPKMVNAFLELYKKGVFNNIDNLKINDIIDFK